MTTTYAYIRVSTDKQEYLRQENVLKEKGYTDAVVHTETMTGTKKHRPVWDKLLETMQAGDTLVVESLSRMGRSLMNVLEAIEELVEVRKINVVIIKEGFDLKANGSMNASTRMMLSVFGALAQFERDLISERTTEALAAKKAQGVQLGRKADTSDDEKVAEMLAHGYKKSHIAEALGTSRPRIDRIIKRLNAEN